MIKPKPTADEQLQIKRMEHTLLQASDAQIAKVVALVDGLEDRGVADELLEPLRPRLKMTPPTRRMTLNRLMFQPLFPLIVSAGNWRRKSPTIPRSALRCLATHVREGMGDEAASIEAQLAGEVFQDSMATIRWGERVWQLSSTILSGSTMPADWGARTGLAMADYKDMIAPIAVVMRQGGAIEQMSLQSAGGRKVVDQDLRACLISAIGHAGPPDSPVALQSMGMLICGILSRTGAFEQVISVTDELANKLNNPTLRKATDFAIDFMLNDAERIANRYPELSEAITQLNQVAALLDVMDKPGANGRPANKARVIQLRRDIDTTCRLRFEKEVATNLVGRANRLGFILTDRDVEVLEQTAQELRSFEAVSRRFGSAAHYEHRLKETVKTLSRLPSASETSEALTGAMDRARLLEILQGPEAGLAFMRSLGINNS